MIFLDYNSTTPLSSAAQEAMKELAGQPLNPSSVHAFGRKGKSYLNVARKQIANLLGIGDQMGEYNLTFTATGTEANNLILQNYSGGEIFISAIEHASISMPAQMLPSTYIIPVDEFGVLDLEFLEKALAGSSASKKLVSVMLANNEVGSVQPIREIAAIAHKHGAQIHSDIVQAVGKLPVDLMELDVDFATISGHKFGGALGCGALISKAVYHLQPMIFGGGQEKSLRSGTENLPAIVATGAAAEYCSNNLSKRIAHLKEIREYLEYELSQRYPDIQIISKEQERLPNTTAMVVLGKSSSLMVIALDLKGIAIGSGSACSSGKVSKSKVLIAMGYDDEVIGSALRVSVGMQTTKEEIDKFLTAFDEVVVEKLA